MLVLRLKSGQKVMIGNVEVTVEILGKQAKLCFHDLGDIQTPIFRRKPDDPPHTHVQ